MILPGTTEPLVWARLDCMMYAMSFFVIIAMCVWYRWYRRRSMVRALTGSIVNKGWLAHYRWWQQTAKALCYLVGVAALVVALLRPQWGSQEQVDIQVGRDLFIALDVSRSMLARDISPDRLSFAKEKIRQLLAALPSDRVGLILFAGNAFVQCPLTSDHAAFLMFLDAVDAQTISSGTTALDQPIVQALQAFAKQPTRKHKMLVMFTDGEDFSGNLVTVKEQARQDGLAVVTVGVGTTEGAPVPRVDRTGKIVGHIHDNQGNVVISRLHEETLYRIAQDTGGKSLLISKDAQDRSDINTIVSYVYTFEQEQAQEIERTYAQERYYLPLWVSFICFILEWLL